MTTVAIIGCGKIARNAHLPALSKMDDVKVKYVCDFNIETANKSLMAAGGVTVKFTKSRTKSGNALTDVEVISK